MRASGFSCLATALLIMAAAVSCNAQPKVTIATQGGREVTFHVEVADTPTKRQMGLQYRQDLTRDQGMIFLFPSEAPQSFWMKNTPLPLDMIFINREMRIVGIVERAVPFSLDPRSVGAPSQFVLEINGGLARQYGIQTGDRVRFEGISAGAVRE